MKAHMSPAEMKKLNFIQSLPYDVLVEAHKIIERGADVALLYFWFNLTQGNYYPAFKIIQVEEQVLYYIHRNPEFEKDILSWFHSYEQIIKTKAA